VNKSIDTDEDLPRRSGDRNASHDTRASALLNTNSDKKPANNYFIKNPNNNSDKEKKVGNELPPY
jgi:hypothetical protein